jgi:hypothetical protein
VWPPRQFAGSGRFDDPRREFRVLYAAGSRRGAFAETMAQFRPSVEFIASRRPVREAARLLFPTDLEESVIPSDWYHRRAIGTLQVAPKQSWLDLRSPHTREALRHELAELLVELEFVDLDVSGVVGPHRVLTQSIARWAYERDFVGIVYASRLDSRVTLWAIFEGASFVAASVPEPIVSDDPDMVATARLFGLRIETS